ncbi:Rieske (2Fe-2S) protein [Sphingobium scionense]|uniref:3-phenylpropionate/trans-cinnamate dioxygenase ferredoxin subunit n=1 Tax=Sphingobium scionense TaxID=1404341 RepID=A0A7W6LLH1_9SPHN|nr:non-heme iron oxygenase ferredoxin subunit [Sphingobium scionense]MBB4146421.1 3-phenylpropionate/trans-cinnamate dioxygenase ferredoxin subunit [Sphingobium scionense]
MSESDFRAVACYDDVPLGKTKAVTIDGRALLLCNSDGQIHAIAALCSHADEPLACGRIRLGWIACPAHGARFDLETGEPLTGPASEPIATYPVRIVDGIIEVAI